ncbi:D-alanyl-D-alanine carboxypeptidase/D-alanyl-D-alanine endopeptidase [Tellurirhabdus rosea]|uniref:D-alanyl-D-alanine carboxypeptidase/D-alanyl-D-alanine endopeptidase n=1 Tax=Tellurirhabdus rosea TaxID=2674997 RepID=UPI0022527171|nr:D-alanyl-D-alanine carboxypeptidase/D-alanyl-D-alanine-endopeptidase [Tellurirhabdus rosea]
MRFLTYILVGLLVFGAHYSPAQNYTGAPTALPAAPDTAALRRLSIVLEELRNSPLVRHGTVGFSLRRAGDGQPLAELNAVQSLAPASTQKLVTTATALAVLGEGYSYQTFLEYDGAIRDSVLTGNLFIRGTGDPSLGSSRFAGFADQNTLLRNWLDALRQAGIRRIEGSLVGDATAVQALPVPGTWSWDDMGNYYGAGVFGLNFNENLYRVIFQPARTVSQPARILRTEPAAPYLQLRNRVRTGPAGSGDEVIIYNAPYSSQVFLEGTVPAGVASFAVRGSLPDPAYAAAQQLHDHLTKSGIVVTGGPLSIGPGSVLTSEPAAFPGKRTALHVHSSPVLSELTRQTNFQSINLYAEALLQAVGTHLAKRPLETSEAAQEVVRFWQRKGIDLGGFRMRDGSGLSTSGALTTSGLSAILAAMSREKSFGAFYESIPVVGESGTVRSLARRTSAAGNVRAKSGTIEGVRAYAGYATSRSGELLAFSVIVSKYESGTLNAVMPYLERLMVLMTEL